MLLCSSMTSYICLNIALHILGGCCNFRVIEYSESYPVGDKYTVFTITLRFPFKDIKVITELFQFNALVPYSLSLRTVKQKIKNMFVRNFVTTTKLFSKFLKLHNCGIHIKMSDLMFWPRDHITS